MVIRQAADQIDGISAMTKQYMEHKPIACHSVYRMLET